LFPLEAEYQSAILDNYTRYFVPAIDEVWATEVLQIAKPRGGDAVLDVACKTGVTALRFSKAVGEAGRVIGVDENPTLLGVARKIGAAFNLGNTSFKESGYDPLPYQDGVFDKVVCTHGLAMFPNKTRVLKEMYRVLSRGGRLIITAHGSRHNNPYETALANAFRKHTGEEPLFFTRLFSLGEQRGMEVELTETGLRHHATVERTMRTFTVATPEAYWLTVAGSSAIWSVYDKLPAGTKDAIRAETLERMQPYRTATGYTAPMEAIIATITKP
jgi:ubiquinone/menaquinone biosynthesis C-methylase UbiE